jgi:hypothetical protein
MLKKFKQFVNEGKEGKYRVFCDLDGVLVDFDRGFQDIEENTENLSPKEYEKKNGKNSIWPLLDKLGADFWANLQWTKDGRELWDYLQRYDPILLSAPSRSPECLIGKTRWVNSNLGIDQEPVTDPADMTPDTRLVLDQDKWKYATSEKDILIDDFKKKLEKWIEHGGTGILHNDSTDTVRVMEEIMTGRD